MPRLTTRDVKEILEMLEEGINSVRKLDKIEKMKMRSKIRRQANWLLTLHNPAGEMVFQRIQERLSDIFPLYPYGFSDKLKKLIEEKSKRVRSV